MNFETAAAGVSLVLNLILMTFLYRMTYPKFAKRCLGLLLGPNWTIQIQEKTDLISRR
jgi:hypothetical protein